MGPPHSSRNRHLIVILVQKSALKRSVKTRNRPPRHLAFWEYSICLYSTSVHFSLSPSPSPACCNLSSRLDGAKLELVGCITLQIITELRTPGPSRLAALRRSRTFRSITFVSSTQTRVSFSQPRAYLPQSPPYQPICLED